jgi:hypothetical protein
VTLSFRRFEDLKYKRISAKVCSIKFILHNSSLIIPKRVSLHKTTTLGKRIFRISAEKALANTEIVGKEINLVLKNGTVFFGILLSIENTVFLCKNMMGKKFQYDSSEIREIIYDQPAVY